MADIQIDSSVNTLLNIMTTGRALVWKDKNIGYVFFLDFTNGNLNYRKTTNYN